MKRFLIAFGSVILCFVLQTTVFQWISFGGIVPNLLIILTASYGFMRGDKAGLLMGIVCGFLTDIFFGSFLGFNALLYMYVGYANGKFHQIFYPEDVKLPLVLILSSDLLYGLSYYCIMFLLRKRFDFSYYFFNIILPEAVYTIILTLLVYPLLLLIERALRRREDCRRFNIV